VSIERAPYGEIARYVRFITTVAATRGTCKSIGTPRHTTSLRRSCGVLMFSVDWNLTARSTRLADRVKCDSDYGRKVSPQRIPQIIWMPGCGLANLLFTTALKFFEKMPMNRSGRNYLAIISKGH
jgi:hypothetical protein